MQIRSKTLWVQRLKRFHIENKGLKLLALLLAVILFTVSRQPISEVRLTGIPIEFKGLGHGMEVSLDNEQTISVRLRGPRDVVRSLNPNQMTVIANLDNKDVGERTIQFRPEDVSRPDDSIEVLQIEPATMRLDIQKTVQKRVEVIPAFVNNVPKGLEIYGSSIKPNRIELEGPESQVQLIESLMTEPINLNDKRSGFRGLFDVEIPHKSIRIKTPGQILVNVEIGEIKTRRNISNIKVVWYNPQPGYRLITRTISATVYGPDSVVKVLTQKDVVAEITTDNLTDTIEFAKPTLRFLTISDKVVKADNFAPPEIKLKRY